jgi:hypothetical protein
MDYDRKNCWDNRLDICRLLDIQDFKNMIRQFFNNHNISLGKIFDLIPAYKAKVGRGNSWISFIQTFIPLQYIIPLLGLKLAFVDKYPFWIIAVGGIIYSVGMEIIKWFIGNLDMKYGIWKRESKYTQNNKTISPFNCQLKKEIKIIKESIMEITAKLGIKHYFDDEK